MKIRKKLFESKLGEIIYSFKLYFNERAAYKKLYKYNLSEFQYYENMKELMIEKLNKHDPQFLKYNIINVNNIK